MATITTKLTTSGNSKAVRLPQVLLRMSRLGDIVELEATSGQIVIRNSKDPRAGWRELIEAGVKANGPFNKSDAFDDLSAAGSDGLDDIPWDGISFEQWCTDHGHGKQ